MNKIYTIAVTLSDDQVFVEALSRAIAATDSECQVLALGAEEDISVLEFRYEGVRSLSDYNSSSVLSHLVLLSCDSLLEIGDYITRAEKVSLWFDPNSEPDESDLLVHKMFYDHLGLYCAKAIVPRTKQGEIEWGELGVTGGALCSPHFRGIKHDNITPLIDKRGKPRVLVDARGEMINTHLVDAFLLLSGIDVEVWCVFDGDLKPWMKPEFLIKSIPLDEEGLFYESVDCVMVCGDIQCSDSIAASVRSGIVPFPLSLSAQKSMSEFFEFNELREEYFPDGITAGVRHILDGNTDFMAYTTCASKYSIPRAFFDFKDISCKFESGYNLREFAYSYQLKLAQQKYMLSKYGNVEGTKLHRTLALNNCIVGELSHTDKSLVSYSGWVLDTKSGLSCSPVGVVDKEHENIDIHFNPREDVLEHFYLETNKLPGFSARFLSDVVGLKKERLKFLVSTAEAKYGIAECMLMDDVVSEEAESEVVLESMVSFGEYDKDLKGRVESVQIERVQSYLFVDHGTSISDCVFRFRAEGKYLDIADMDIACIVDNKVVEDAVQHINDTSFSVSIDKSRPSKEISVLVCQIGCSKIEKDVRLVVSCAEAKFGLSSNGSAVSTIVDTSVGILEPGSITVANRLLSKSV